MYNNGYTRPAKKCLYLGLRSTRMTESPRRNIFEMKRSLLTGRPPLAPRPRLGTCRQSACSKCLHMCQCVRESTEHCNPSHRRLILPPLPPPARPPSRPWCPAAVAAAPPSLRTSVHISLTFSRIMLQCRSNAFTRPSSLWLFLQLINTCLTNPGARRAAESGSSTGSSTRVRTLSSIQPLLPRMRIRGCVPCFSGVGAAA